jgi:hypothetical protein
MLHSPTWAQRTGDGYNHVRIKPTSLVSLDQAPWANDRWEEDEPLTRWESAWIGSPRRLPLRALRPIRHIRPTVSTCCRCLPGTQHPFDRKLFWRYKANGQRAVRDGDYKFIKILDNTFLFNMAEDPMERANLKERRKDIYQRLEAEWLAWNATMLPEIDESFTHGFSGAELADHIGTPKATGKADSPTPQAKPSANPH